MLEALRKQVCAANKDLVRHGLVTLTWGNVSGIDRKRGLIVIKPSGVDYAKLTPARMVVVDLNNRVVEGKLRPSSDTPTHVKLYSAFPRLGGISHTHSTYAVMFAQACREIPCFGTTHADHFNGPVPVTRFLTETRANADYEGETGAVIIECIGNADPFDVPAVLVAGHAPFTFGVNAADAVENSLVLERVAQMALGTIQLNRDISALPSHILQKHHNRKHGPDAYYGQKK
jgi:L-ribulose-5-phosphate 4-epimerase